MGEITSIKMHRFLPFVKKMSVGDQNNAYF